MSKKSNRSNRDKSHMHYHPAIGWFSTRDYPVANRAAIDNSNLSPAQWALAKLNFTADPSQQQILDSKQNRILVNCSRQWGKSTTAAIKALYQAIHKPGSLTLILSPSARQSNELFGKIKAFLKILYPEKKQSTRNSSSYEFPNGARIVALPGNETTIRGFSAVALLIVDEAARVTDTLYAAARPFLATTDGTLLVMSTPKGQSGFFHREWVSDNKWLRVSVPASECPRIKKEFLDSERAQSGERYFNQEYMCEFLGAQSNLFSAALLERIHSTNFDPLNL